MSVSRGVRDMTTPLRALLLASMLAGSIAPGWHALGSTLALALSSEAYTHILLILPLTCALIYMARAALPQVFRSNVREGPALLAAALLLAGLVKLTAGETTTDVRLSLNMIALVMGWIGSVVICFGIQALRAFLFPLFFLFWLVPIPEFALNEIVQFLQHQSALAARILFVLAGVPVTQEGIVLSVPGWDVEVARECSSIRSSVMLVVTTMVLAHLFLRSRWRKALLIVVAVPLAAIKNGLRIFTLVQIGTRWDASIFDSDLHHRGGILFFAVSVGLTLGVLWILRRSEGLQARDLEPVR